MPISNIKSCQFFTDAKVGLKSDTNMDTYEETDKEKKEKKAKKKKKHKEEKSKKKKKKREKEENSDDQTKMEIKPKKLKKSLLLNENQEGDIGKKTVTCYHETVTKLKEIEKLSIGEKKNNGNFSKNENNVKHKEKVLLANGSVVLGANECTKTVQKNTDLKGNDKKVADSNEKSENGILYSKPEILSPVPAVKSELNASEIQKTAVSCPVENLQGVKVAKSNSTQELKTTAEVQGGNNVSEAKVEKNNQKTDVKCEISSQKNEDSNKRRDSRRKRSRSRSRSRKHRKRSHSRSRSRSPRHRRHHHRHRHHRSRSRERHRNSSSSRYRRKEKSPKISKEDKVKLLEIAKANVLAQHRADSTLTNLSSESLAVIRSGGVTVEQLTGVCKDIMDGKREVTVQNEAKINHPYQVKEAPSITINIKSQVPVPPVANRPLAILSKEFPVSSGSQHQREDVYGKWEPIRKEEKKDEVKNKVFKKPAVEENNTLMIKDVIAERVHAVRELESNPCNETALNNMQQMQVKLDKWMKSKIIPGQFTGSSGLQPLSRMELERGQQAWANNSTLNSGKQVGGIGKALLQKMGWKEGEPLGKTMTGSLEPLRVNVKTDRKGLTSIMECKSNTTLIPAGPIAHKGNFTAVRDLSGKHPVSALMEICSKRKWSQPNFQLVHNSGPDHQRFFMFKVTINGQEYQPSAPSVNKKLAKANSASVALQGMGLIPKVD
ncbi:protein Son-like [Ciona intestinalis]